MGLRLPHNLILTIGWYSQFWWRIQDEGLNCSVADRESVLANSLAFSNLVFLHQADDITMNTSTGIVSWVLIHVFMHVCVCVCMYMYVCMCVYACVCMHVCVYLCVYVCMHVCVYVICIRWI